MPVCARDGFSARSRKCAAVRSTTERQLAASGIELGAAAGMLLKDLAGCEPNTMALGQALEITDQAEHQTLEDLRRSGPAVRMNAEQAVDALVHTALLAAFIDVETAARLAAQTAFLHEGGNPGARGRNYPIAVRRLHDSGDFDRDVESDLIQQRNRADGKSEPHGHRVDVFDRRTLGEQMPDFVAVGRENAVYPEARTVLHHDHRLADAPPEGNRRAHSLRRRARARNDLEQRHLR